MESRLFYLSQLKMKNSTDSLLYSNKGLNIKVIKDKRFYNRRNISNLSVFTNPVWL